MTRFGLAIMLIIALGSLVALPAFAADPTISRSVLTTDDGTTVVLLSVKASGKAIYGINIDDASGSVDDIIAPKGWAGITSGDRILFRTVDTPIQSGKTVVFRIVTANETGELDVSFRDSKSYFGKKKTI